VPILGETVLTRSGEKFEKPNSEGEIFSILIRR
jgi:hypothetical protein